MTDFTHAAITVFADGAARLGRDVADPVERGSGGDVAHRALNAVHTAHEVLFAGTTDDAEQVELAMLRDYGEEADIAVTPLANRRKRLLICDMDSTIIGQECLDELADYAGLKAEISAITERAMRGELDFEGALTERVAMLNGLDLSALARCYTERITLNPGAKTLVSTMKKHGARCVLVSGGFTFFTSRVAQAADFHANLGNTLLDDGAALTGEVARPILGREAKLDALDAEAGEAGLVRDDALAIGDGANDLAMIEAAGLGLAYRAKPIVAAQADAAVTVTDLTTALYFQGYAESEFARPANSSPG